MLQTLLLLVPLENTGTLYCYHRSAIIDCRQSGSYDAWRLTNIK